MMDNLFEHSRIIDAGPHEFRRCVQRLLLQNKFAAFSVDGPGDEGGDLLCERDGESWVVQTKWKKSAAVGAGDVNEVLNARIQYDAHRAIIATNQYFSHSAVNEVETLQGSGIKIDLWAGEQLREYASQSPNCLPSKQLRPYQASAMHSIKNCLENNGRALLYLATGLGKTVVAGAVMRDLYNSKPNAKILVLAHMNELIEQLQKALWEDIPLSVPSQLINSMNAPNILEGVTVSTNLSIKKYIDAGYTPDLIVVDECHHVGEFNMFADVIARLSNIPLLGVTATPWRGDGFEIEDIFGKPSYVCGIEQGMKDGYLTPVDYRLYCDNINWDAIPQLSHNSYSIKQLNKKLFLPQRDQEIIDKLTSEWLNITNPKCIVFCQGVEHAQRFHEEVLKYDRWKSAEILHSSLNMMDRKMALLRFRSDTCPMLIAVDILNEGVDVPNVNIICFARVTHSRKIFVQQLGRGLRVAPDKEKVVVLDFAADTRRLAAIYGLQSAIKQTDPLEELHVNNNTIEFSDQRTRTLVEEWIQDAADLETKDQESVLQFPSIEI